MGCPHQDAVAKSYNSVTIQIGVAVLIAANFLVNIIEKEIDPLGDKHDEVFGVFEVFFNICFTVELIVNMWAHGFGKEFWKSGWNIFDFVVVMIGLVTMSPVELPSAFNMFRMMRAFRVFRLFNRVHSLNKIIVAITHSLPGVRDAFLILAIVMSIYAILAVEFYYEVGKGCLGPDGEAKWITPRGFCMGEEYYGTFSKSFYTFFQTLTGESWSEMVARPTIWFYDDTAIKAVGSAFLFVSYVLVTAFVLTNVVVAVLLDKMVDPDVAAATSDIVKPGEKDATTENGDTTVAGDPEPKVSEFGVTPDALTPDELRDTMKTVTSQVESLTADSTRMSSEMDTFRSDMKSIREQLETIIKCVVPRNQTSDC